MGKKKKIKKEQSIEEDTRLIRESILNAWDWPYCRTNLGGVREYACPHGIGHGGIHGCDGCCSNASYLKTGE